MKGIDFGIRMILEPILEELTRDIPAEGWLAIGVLSATTAAVLFFASLQLSGEIMASWTIQNLAQYAFAGMAVGAIADGMTVRVSSRLPAPAERVWELLLRKDTFLAITRGMVGYADSEQWPDRLFTPGTALTTQVRLFGCGPASHHEVRVVRVDETAREIETEEHGGLVSVWNHRMQVDAVSSLETRYTDSIELRAGLLTPAVCSFAYVFYWYRQRQWRYLLAERISD